MVWICNECKKNPHGRCTNKFSCDCHCNVGNAADVTQKGTAIVGGIGLAVGGLALTICTGGLGAVLIGGAMLGAGVSSTWQGAEKSIKGERIDGKSYFADVAFGAATGLAIGGIGAGGEVVATSVIKQGVKVGAQKLATRTITGAVIGVTAKTIDEVKQCTVNDKEWKDFGKNLDENGKERGTATAWIIGATVGGLGGAASHVSSNLSKQVSSGVAKAATRVAVSGTAAGASDALVQGVNIATGNQDEYNIKQTLTCATASVVMTAAQEGAKNAIYEVNGGKNRVLIKKTVPNEKLESALNGYDDTKKLPESTKIKAKNVAELRTRWKNNIAIKENEIKQIEQEIKQGSDLLTQAKSQGNTDEMNKQLKHTKNLKVTLKNTNRALQQLKQDSSRDFPRQILGNQNAHYLDGDRLGQLAIDDTPSNGNARGAGRLLFDTHVNNQGREQWKYSGYTKDHNYSELPGQGQGAYYETPGRYNNNIYENKNCEYREENQASRKKKKKKEN